MSGKEKNQKKRRGGKPPHPRLSQGATPHIGRESDSITMGFSPAGTRQSHMKALKAMSERRAMPFYCKSPLILNHLSPIRVNTELFGGLVFPMSPPKEIIAKYPRQTQKTQIKALKIPKAVFYTTNKHHSTG